MKTIAQHQKDARNAPNFVLTGDKEGLFYVADKKLSGGSSVTRDINAALKFSVGYDDERMKSRAWSMSLGTTISVVAL